MEQKVKNGVFFGVESIAVTDFWRDNKNITAGNIESGIIDGMFAVSRHNDVKFIEIVGVDRRVRIGFVMKIGLHQFVRLKDIITCEMF